MPALDSGTITTLRDTKHASNLYMYIIRPPTAATATVNGAHDAASTIINVTGWNNTKAVESHYLTEIDGHRALFQAYNPTTQELSLSRNDLPALSGGEAVVIKEYVPPAVLLPYVDPDTGTIYADNAKAYVNENDSVLLARIGTPVAVAQYTAGTATMKWYSDSLASAGIATHAWTFEGGNPASSSQAGTSESPIEVTYDTPGQYLTKYTVTDNNGRTHTRYAWAVIVDESINPPYHDSDFMLSNLRGGWNDGYWDCEIEVYGDADVTEFPDLALVCLFARDYYDGVEQSIGGRWTHRENLVAVGFIVAGSTSRDDETSSTSFQIEGLAGIAKSLLCWPANLQSVGDAGWHTIPNMTFDKAAFHVLTEHTTLDHIADVNFPSISKTLYSIDLPETDPYDALDGQLYSALRCRFLSSREGMIYFCANPQLLAAGERPTIVVLDLDDQDWIGKLNLGDEQFVYSVSQIDLIAFGGDEDLVEYASLAPAGQHPTGRVEQVTGIRADDQSEANVIAGHWEAWQNNEFANIRLTLKGNYRVFDIIRDEAVTLTCAASGNNRGLDWSAVKCYVKEVEIKYDYPGEGFEIDLTLEKDVSGAPGATNPLDGGPSDPPEPQPPSEPTDPIGPPISPPGEGEGTLWMGTDGTGPFRSVTGGQSWEDIGD